MGIYKAIGCINAYGLQNQLPYYSKNPPGRSTDDGCHKLPAPGLLRTGVLQVGLVGFGKGMQAGTVTAGAEVVIRGLGRGSNRL